MAKEPIRLSYNALSYRVRCEISRAHACESERPPYDLIIRARSKLEAVKKSQQIDFYFIYESRLFDVWKRLQEAFYLPEDRKITFTLGMGAPSLGGVVIAPPVADKSLANLSVAPLDGRSRGFSYDWFKLNVLRNLRENQIKDQPHDALLCAIWMKLMGGATIQGLPLMGIDRLASMSQAAEKPYSLIASKQRFEISLLVRRIQELASSDTFEEVFRLVRESSKQIGSESVKFIYFKKEAVHALQQCLEGPELLGVDLPMTILMALGVDPSQNKETKAPDAPFNSPPANYSGAGILNFNVSSNGMEAQLSGFDPSYYEQNQFKVELEWIANEMKRNGIKAPIPDDMAKALSEAIAKKESLNGLFVCRGKPGRGGKKPYLYHTYTYASERIPTQNLDHDAINLRELQNRQTVHAQQLVAEVRYEVPPEFGIDIFGVKVEPPESEEIPFRAGDGIELRDGFRFFAKEDGLPTFENNVVSLGRALIHKGDVNLRSGNIRFSGPVEITGSIEEGATIEVRGDLVVGGEIRGARVYVWGHVTVKGGVSTGDHGVIHCRGDFKADFVANSHVIANGHMIVNKAILNSDVACGGEIQILAADGTIGGGHIICRESIRTNHLGFRSGAITTLDVGVDWRIAHGIEVREKRLEKCHRRWQEDRQALREIIQKSKAQMTPRYAQMKDQLQTRLARLKQIIERLEQRIQTLKSNLTYSEAAQIYVKGVLVPNIKLTLCGQNIPVVGEFMSACIVPKRRKGNYIVALEEVEALEGGVPLSEPSPEDDKKAS